MLLLCRRFETINFSNGVSLGSKVNSTLQHTLEFQNFLFLVGSAYILLEQPQHPSLFSLSLFFFFSPSRLDGGPDRQEIWNWGRSIRDKSRKLGETFSSTIELQRVSHGGLRGNCISMINCEIFNIWKLSYD